MASTLRRIGSSARSLAIAACVAAAALAGASRSSAQLLPLGPDFQVNEYTTGWQGSPRVVAAPDGSFTVVWNGGEPPPGYSVWWLVGRRFDAQGQPLGGEFQVSQYEPRYPSGIGADADGNFIVVWGQGSESCPPCRLDYIKARRFTVDGQPREAQFAVSPPPGGAYTGDGNVAVAPGGGFVVAWQDYWAWARRFTADGTPIGAAFQVGGENGYSSNPVVANQATDGFVIAWDDVNWTAHENSLVAQRYDAAGLPVGARIQVSDLPVNWPQADISSKASGDFVVAWTSYSPSPTFDDEIVARRFAADGTPLGAEQVANTLLGPAAWGPAVTSQTDGGFVVAWYGPGSPGSDTSGDSIQARLFAADGTPLGTQLQLNEWTTGDQYWPALAVLQANGDLVVTWTSDTSPGNDSSSSSVLARRFRPAFFMDGFETGDTSRWSAAMPSGGAPRRHPAR
jgi:hypothetical protein